MSNEIEAAIHFERAYELMKTKQLDDASDEIDIGLSTDSSNIWALGTKGQILWRQGKNIEAAELFRKALIILASLKSANKASAEDLELGPSFLQQQAEAYWMAARDDKIHAAWALASDCFMEYLSTYGETAPVWYGLSMCKWNLKDRVGAISAIKRSIELDPSNGNRYVDLYRFQWKSLRIMQALRTLIGALRIAHVLHFD